VSALAINALADGRTITISIRGSLTARTSRQLVEVVDALDLGTFNQVVMDLRDVDRIDAVAAGVLLHVRALVTRAGARLSITGSPEVTRALHELNVADYFRSEG